MTPRESTKFPKHYASKFRLAHAIFQNIGNLVWTAIEWDFQEFDVLEEALIVNPWTFTPLETGYYLLHAAIQTGALLLGDTLEIAIRNGGVQNVGNSSIGAGFNNELLIPSVSVIHYLVAGAVIDVVARQNSGGAAAIGGNRYSSIFFGERIG